jgi:lysyl-tRNA synthetase class 1
MPDDFVAWAARTKLFDDLTLLREGIQAWYEGDYVKAIHVLVPQVEHALRSIARELGLPVTKPAPGGVGASVAINMSDMLYNRPEITQALGEDLTLHFKALYADPKGFNLRNFLAHGMMDAASMTFGTATRVIHTLLLLGAWKEIAKLRAAKGEQPPADAE